jgi:hypothetical protein
MQHMSWSAKVPSLRLNFWIRNVRWPWTTLSLILVCLFLKPRAAGVARWSSALTPSREDASSIPNPGNPCPTLGIGASPLFQDLAGRFCSILNMARLVPKNRTPCRNWRWDSQNNPIHKKVSQTQQCLMTIYACVFCKVIYMNLH